jgi:hypothetical protein
MKEIGSNPQLIKNCIRFEVIKFSAQQFTLSIAYRHTYFTNFILPTVGLVTLVLLPLALVLLNGGTDSG